MERAGSVPLFIYYCCQNPDPFENVVFQDLLDQVHRWSEFYFRGSGAYSMFKATCAPLLRVLDFYYVGGMADAIDFPFVSCPSLIHLNWPWLESLPTENSVIPWMKLQRLRTWYIQPEIVSKYVVQAKSLLHFHCMGGHLQGPFPAPGSLTHPNLQSLVIPCSYLVWLVLPQLSHLLVTGHTDELPHFLLRSNCRLQSLAFNSYEVRTDCLSSILHSPSSTSLTELCLPVGTTVWFTTELLTDLTYTSHSSEVLCPNLKILHLSRARGASGQLGPMVFSRFTHPQSHLEQFEYYDFSLERPERSILIDGGFDEFDRHTIFAIPNVHVQCSNTWISITRDRIGTGSLRFMDKEPRSHTFSLDEFWREHHAI
ncbi:hypothetical protein AMATHDRAFT_66875 [Amanita thiersii Skay4041]|uniref:F-box domain-containing protein n=1 Tax=Amanita thiersii Skay4041 TaxID=703135 RepID=A0A2A9NEM1_9AGAR|nr:hypothetical protein AMATHDRAFT_66875 [Amanita thiersii Skay4041]